MTIATHDKVHFDSLSVNTQTLALHLTSQRSLVKIKLYYVAYNTFTINAKRTAAVDAATRSR